jgi:Uma2 family endonuclease
MPLMRAERPRVSYADLERMPDDGRRFEIIDGELIDVTPAPSPFHQYVSKRLQRQLEAYFEDGGLGIVYDAPVDVVLTDFDVFEPDIVVVTNRSAVTRRAIEGVPELVVEVLSPSTTKYDRVKKGNRYAALGIRNYWILDPAARRLECFRLHEGAYELAAACQNDDHLEAPHFPGLVVDLAAVWR